MIIILVSAPPRPLCCQVMAFLNELFTLFDELVDRYRVYKVETAGDCYIVAGGLIRVDSDGFVTLDHDPDCEDGARRVVAFAKVRACMW